MSLLCGVGLNFWKLRGRHCPLGPLQFNPQQKKILHLAQKKDPPAVGHCSRVLLNLELLVDNLSMDESCSKIIQPSDTHECTASVQVDASLLRFIVGKGGTTKKKIEKDTATHLQIPRPHEAKRGSCLVVVKGSSQAKVDDAVSQIHCILEEAAESPSLEYSHFISLPLALHPDLVQQVTRFHDSVMALFPAKDQDSFVESSSPCIENSANPNEETEAFESKQVAALGHTFTICNEEIAAFEGEQVGGLRQPSTETFLNDVNEQCNREDLDHHNPETLKEREDDAGIMRLPLKGHGVEESIFIKPATFHLTVLMLKLWNKERVAAAVEVLQGLNSKLLEALDHRPVAVVLNGVECMRGTPAKAHVLYAKVEDADQENRLLCACRVIKDAFIEAGLVSEKDKKEELKLHATLMNTSHRKRKRGKRFGRRVPFDARPILSIHGAEEWGEYTITEAHLSERFVYDEDGYYHCCGSVKFPLSLALPI